MGKEFDTEEGRNRRIVKDEVMGAEKGIVTEVYEHTDPDDHWNWEADVRISEEKHPRKVPIAVPAPGMVAPPRDGDHPDGPDHVMVQYFKDDQSQRPVVTHFLYDNVDRPPMGTQGDVRIRRGDFFFEMADDGSYARLSQRNDANSSPDLVIEVNDSGTVKLGSPSGDLQPIARQGDSVEVTDGSGNTYSGEITGGSSNVESS